MKLNVVGKLPPKGTPGSLYFVRESKHGDGGSLYLAAECGTLCPVSKFFNVTVAGQGEKGEQGLRGEVGKQGQPGRDGKDGASGKDAVRGEMGPRGFKGDPGRDGSNGKDGTNGRDGRDGKDGAIGPQGPAGDITIVGDAQLKAALDKLQAKRAATLALIHDRINSRDPYSGLIRATLKNIKQELE
jgi:hypothetical protein